MPELLEQRGAHQPVEIRARHQPVALRLPRRIRRRHMRIAEVRSAPLRRSGAWTKPAEARGQLPASVVMASPQTLTTPQRLAAIREQMSLLSDYL